MDSRVIAADFKEYLPECIINEMLDSGDSIIVSLTRKDIPKDSYMLDMTYLYNKKTRKIRPFVVLNDPKRYKEATKHVLFRR